MINTLSVNQLMNLPFPNASFRTLYADPPWPEIGGGKIVRGAQAHYDLMKVADILAMGEEVKRVSMSDAHLYLWVTNNYLHDGLHVMEAWGFRYKTTISWAKLSLDTIPICDVCYSHELSRQGQGTTSYQNQGRENLRVLRSSISGKEQRPSSKILQPVVFGKVEDSHIRPPLPRKTGSRESALEGRDRSQGIPSNLQTRTSSGGEVWTSVRTSNNHGTSDGAISDIQRGSSPQERGSLGQQAGELGTTSLESSKQCEITYGNLSSMQPCISCGLAAPTRSVMRSPRFGLGQYFRGMTEPCLFGVRGMVPYKVLDGKRQQGTTLLTVPRQEHSAKPLLMYEQIEKVSTGPYLELFSRQTRTGWQSWGNEAEPRPEQSVLPILQETEEER